MNHPWMWRILTLLSHQGCLQDYQCQHLPQAQEEEEGDEQSHHGDAMTQEVYDHSNLVVHLAFFLQDIRKDEMSLLCLIDSICILQLG